MANDDEPVIESAEALTPVSAVERFGKYRSLGRIGQGGMADVFLAVGRGPAGFNKLVVVKRLRDQVASDETFRDMFLDEARLAARLNHPNVVQTYEVFEHEGAFFITMEYLEGQPLSRISRECAKRGIQLPPQMHARIVSDVLCGLHYAHDARDFDGVPLEIVHRDVSPQNIFVTYNGQIKVVDFGIAKAERSNTKTQAGFFKGKAAYMAPEQLEGGVIDRRVDVFTTGIVLWELLVGKRLMAAESTAKTLVRLLQEAVPRVSEMVPNIDPRLDRIVARALERDPDARFQTAGEMRDALEQYLHEGQYVVRHEEIGRVVSEVFRDARADLQREIRTQMARASEFPRTQSGTMSVPNLPIAAPVLTPGADPASLSGLNVSQSSSALHAAPQGTGIIIAERAPARNVWLTSAAVAAIAAVSVAVIFTLVDRARSAATAPPVAPAALAPAPPAPTQHPVAQPAPEPAEMAAPEPRTEPAGANVAAGAAPAAAAPRPVQAQPVWRPTRPQPAPAPARPPAPAPAATHDSAPAPAPVANEPPAVRSVTPPPPATPPAPTATATQEGRKFRTTL